MCRKDDKLAVDVVRKQPETVRSSWISRRNIRETVALL